jgi:enamine deaminase RidA (YjgF/YER057c/UK114 family)
VKSNRRSFLKKGTTVSAAFGAPLLYAQSATNAAGDRPARSSHTHDGIYYFPGLGANSGYSKDDRIRVTDPFDKHVVRTMDALKKTVERAGCTMDSILHLEVYICLPHADDVPMPSGKARFDAHTAQYQALNKIYGTYFSPGKAPSRACMAVEWIPGDSLIEVVGSALVVKPPTPAE